MLRLLLLDDPLSAVDVNTEQNMINEFIKIRDEGNSVLLTTQRFTALPYCNRIIFINQGSIEFDGPASDFLTNPRYNSFIRGLI